LEVVEKSNGEEANPLKGEELPRPNPVYGENPSPNGFPVIPQMGEGRP